MKESIFDMESMLISQMNLEMESMLISQMNQKSALSVIIGIF